MKKIFSIVVTMFVALQMSAVDVIVTRSAQRIEAKITEVSSTEIKYKEANNLNGPLFVLTTAEISTIIYENGTVKVFDQQQSGQPSYGQSVSQYGSQPSRNSTLLPITKSDKYYLMGDQRMNEEQYMNFLHNNCKEAWEYHRKGKKLWKDGWTCFGVGVGFEFIGGVLFGVGINSHNSDVVLGCGIPGGILLGAGSGLLVASVPCLVIGGIRKNNSHEIYNVQCAKQVAFSFDFKTTGNGVGIAMHF